MSITEEQMRQRFNDGGYQQRIDKGEFRILRKTFKPEPSVLKDFGDVISVGTYCFNEANNEIVYTHHYESPNGERIYRDKQTGAIYKGAKMDPKRIFEDGVQYHLKRPSK